MALTVKIRSDKIWAAGLVIRDLPLLVSNFRSEQSLDQYLADRGIVGIADIDTRKLTVFCVKQALKVAVLLSVKSISKKRKTIPWLKGNGLGETGYNH